MSYPGLVKFLGIPLEKLGLFEQEAKELTTSRTTLNENVRQAPLFMADDLPGGLVSRPKEFEQLKWHLLNDQQIGLTAITSTLLGAGGYGKTMLAIALCHDLEVRERFQDGILWVTLGEKPINLIGKIEDLIELLRNERPGFTSLEAAKTMLKAVLANGHYLLVIDDVWRETDLLPFLHGAPQCMRLITTRNSQVLPPHNREKAIPVDAMDTKEAIQLLSTDIEISESENQAKQLLEKLTVQLGEWPLLLKIVNGVLRDRVNRFHEPMIKALSYLQRALKNRGITAFDAKNTSQREKAVAATLEVSLQQLDETERNRYEELAIFPEDADVPLTTISQFWGRRSHCDDAEEFCQHLYDLSLLISYNLRDRSIRLHDVVRAYLQVKVDTEDGHLSDLHRQFLDTYALSRWANLPDKDVYLWEHLVEHLVAAERKDDLFATMKDIRYLAAKVDIKGVSYLEQDLGLATRTATHDSALVVLNQQVKRMTHLLSRGDTRHEIGELLVSGLCGMSRLADVCAKWEQETYSPVLLAWHPLPELHNTALKRTLSEHAGSVNGCAISPDGKWLISASEDNTLKIWDSITGEVRQTLTGHTGWVSGCAISPDGTWVVSVSRDRTLKIWDVATGEIRYTLTGHTRSVNGCVISPDGKWLLSASGDNTLRIWDSSTTEIRHVFAGHTSGVNGYAISPDGTWFLSASGDNTLKIWDSVTGEVRLVLTGHTRSVNKCTISPDSAQLISVSGDNTLRIWDTTMEEVRHILTGHTKWVFGCAISPDGTWLVSSSHDSTLRIWDTATGETRHILTGHMGGINGCAISTNGK